MDRSNYGNTAGLIGHITDPAQLTAMLKNPQYAGFTNVIIARLTEINRMRQAAQGATPQPPTIAEQAIQGAQQPQQPPQQGMARGGIVAFKHGGKVRKFAEGGKTDEDPYAEGWGNVGKNLKQMGRYTAEGAKKLGSVALDIGQLPAVALRRGYNAAVGLPNAMGADIPYVDRGSLTPYYDRYARSDSPVTAYEGGKDSGAYGGPDDDRSANIQAVQQTAPQQPEIPFAPYKDTSTGNSGIAKLMASAGSRGKERGFEAYADPVQKWLGEDKDAAEARADAKADKANALNHAMMYGGLGMARAAGEHPQTGFLGSMATGATEGLSSYDKAALERQRELRELGKQERGERLGIGALAVKERGDDLRADRLTRAQMAMAGMGQKEFQEKAQHIKELAAALKQQDYQNKQPIKPDAEYHVAATARYAGVTPQMQAAELRASAAEEANFNQWLKANPALQDKDPTYVRNLYNASRGGGAGSSGASAHRGAL